MKLTSLPSVTLSGWANPFRSICTTGVPASVLIATSRYYSVATVMPLLVPLLLLNLGLIILGSWLIYHSIHRIHRYDRLIRELTQKYRSIAEYID